MRSPIALVLVAVVPACLTGDPATDDGTGADLGKADIGGTVSGNGCTKANMFVMGTPRNFGVWPGGPLQMSCVGGAWQIDEIFAGTGNVFAAGAFKFHETGNWQWGINWG